MGFHNSTDHESQRPVLTHIPATITWESRETTHLSRDRAGCNHPLCPHLCTSLHVVHVSVQDESSQPPWNVRWAPLTPPHPPEPGGGPSRSFFPRPTIPLSDERMDGILVPRVPAFIMMFGQFFLEDLDVQREMCCCLTATASANKRALIYIIIEI